MITQKEIKNLLHYDKDTGIFNWLKEIKYSKHNIGDIAGKNSINTMGYMTIMLNRKRYLTHRLAWLYVHGVWPKVIDHINGIKTDNRIENLRVVTVRQNQQNRVEHRNGKLVGASYNKRDKKWNSKIVINGKQKHLGYFDTEEQAHEAYMREIDINQSGF